MVFPDGIEYDHKNDEYRTFRVNTFFSYIPVISKELGHKKTGKFRKKTKNSGLVPEAGNTPIEFWQSHKARKPNKNHRLFNVYNCYTAFKAIRLECIVFHKV